MINIVSKSSIPKPPNSVSGKATQASGGTSKKTFGNVLGETVQKNSQPAKIPALYNSTDYIGSASPVAKNIADYDESSPEVKTFNETMIYAEYVEIEIDGRIVKQVTDEFLARRGYNLDVLRANHIDDNLLKYIDENGFVPKYLVPMDMARDTDYARSLATPENLAHTWANNADFDNFSLYGTHHGTYGKAAQPAGDKRIIQDNAQKVPEKPADKSKSRKAVPDSAAAKTVGASDNTPISQSNAQKSPDSLVGKMDSLVKAAAHNAALRILSSMNVWDSKDSEKDDDKK